MHVKTLVHCMDMVRGSWSPVGLASVDEREPRIVDLTDHMSKGERITRVISTIVPGSSQDGHKTRKENPSQ
jgi:hypothetical protein